MGIQPTIEIANLGMADTLILMVVALVVVGPRKLPQIGRQIGKLMYEFRKASNDFKFQMEEELRNAEEADRRKKEEERLLTLAPPAQPTATDAVSQVSETGSGAPGFTQADTVESPYPGDVLYPSALETAADAPAVEAYPRIQPPSTGEQVPAARPTSLAGQARAEAQAAEEPDALSVAEVSSEADSVTEAPPAEAGDEAQPDETAHVPEQAAHHG
jgi:sec-independent protein translocase protein TatB